MNLRVLPALVASLMLCPVHAEQNSAQRVRVFAALPNWTGFWQTDAAALLIRAGVPPVPNAKTSAPGGSSPAPKPATLPAGRTTPDAPAVDPALTEFFLKLVPLTGKPPYNAEWQKKYRDGLSHASSAPLTTSAAEACQQGFPAVIDSPTPEGMFQVLVAPEATVFLFGDGQTRLIYTDGRSHPKPEDLWPTNMGDSIGHWEAGTLVIDTIARIAGPVYSAGPVGEPTPYVAALSEQAHFTERLRLIDANTMRDDLTIADPQRFAHPWKLSISYQRVTDVDRMIIYRCEGQDRNPIVKGKLTISPP
jgi:hypothetical protein